MVRRLPTAAETTRILAEKHTRPQRRAPPPAGRHLTKVIKELDARFGQTDGVLHARWREIVGDAVAQHSEPIKLIRGRAGAGGTLQLKVNGAIAALVQHQGPEIMARANLVLGSGAVERLRIVQGPVRIAPQRLDPAAIVRARRRARRPLDAADEAILEEGLANAPDGPLKSALRSLGREVMRRRGE